MLPAQNRLRHEKDIKALFSEGKGVFDALCGLKYRKNGLGSSRFAVVVGTKVSKNAVDRNRVRRRIRSVLEARLALIKPGFDVAFLTRPGVTKKDFAAIEAAVVSSLKRAKLL
ncbi:ribonuclease P protein component [Patescibacteria group bacterium]|nr:MAG: ribonuclease P protein component [Patescibacteria group bacterium]